MNGFSAADMSTAAANGHAEGYQAGYADAVKAVEIGKPAAAQEAVGWQRRYKYPDGSNGPWCSVSKDSYDETVCGKWADRYDVRELFAAPVAAAPVVPMNSDDFDAFVDDVATEHGEMLDDGGPSGWSFSCEDLVAFAKHLINDYKGVLIADAYAIARAEAKRDSTPAAPGIDLGPIRRLIEGVRDLDVKDSAKNANAGFVDQRCIGALRGIANDAERALDASPKGGSSDDFGAMTDLLARWRHNASIESSPNMAGKARREVWVQCLGELEFALQATSHGAGVSE